MKSPVRRLSVLGSLLAVIACSDALAPARVGALYQLRRINGQPVPWTPPLNDSAYIAATITEGWITFLDVSTAQRHERLERWVTNVNGDSTLLVSDWTNTAGYQRLKGRIVLTYAPTPGGGGGMDTLYLGPRGSLILRQTSYLASDSIVRQFCSTPGC